MRVYDNYEISGCHRLDRQGKPRRNGPYTEPCDDDQAHFWTLYGHIDGEGVQAIGDFATREEAEQVYFRITGQLFASSAEAKARLRLMHAGPKLLEALEALLADIDDLASEFGICDEIINSSYGKAAYAAVAEATGRAA